MKSALAASKACSEHTLKSSHGLSLNRRHPDSSLVHVSVSYMIHQGNRKRVLLVFMLVVSLGR